MRRSFDRRRHADARRGHGQLVENALFEVEKPVETIHREDRPHEHAAVRAADAVDAAVPLHQPHRVPRHVEIDDVPALLKVYAFCQHVGGDQEVVAVRVLPRRRLHRDGREPLHRFLPGHFGQIARAADRDHPATVAPKLRPCFQRVQQGIPNPLDGILEEREHQHLAFPGLVDGVRGLAFGLPRDPGQLAGQRPELRVPVRCNRRRFGFERPEQIAIPLHRLAQALHVVERGVGAVLRPGEHVFEYRVVVGRQLLHEVRGDDVTGIERIEKRAVLAHHLPGGPAEGEGRGLDMRCRSNAASV